MIKTNRLPLVATIITLISLSLFSCQKSEGTDEGSTMLPSPLTIEMSDLSAGNFSADISIDKSSSCGKYLVGAVSKEYFDTELKSDDKLAAHLIESILERTGSLSRVDNLYIFSGDSSAPLHRAWEITPSTDYIVAAFGVSASGTLTTSIKTINATSSSSATSQSTSLKITTSNATTSNIRVSIEMAQDAPFNIYYVAPVSHHDYVEYFGSNKVKVVSALIQSATNSGMDLSIANDYCLFDESATFDIGDMWDLESDCDYYIFAFGIDKIGTLKGDIAIENAHTTAFEDGFDIALSEITPAAFNIKLKATPEANVNNYCVFAISESDVEAGNDSGSDFELAKYVRDYLYFIGCKFAVADGVYIFNGESDIDISKMIRLTSSTKYSLLAFGISNSGSIETPITRVNTETLAPPTLSGSLKSIEIVDNDSRSFDVKIDKGDFSGYYFVGVYLKEYFDSYCKGNEYTLAKMFMEDEISLNTDFTVVDNTYIFDQSTTYNTFYSWTCRPNNEYIVIAFGIDFGGGIASNVIYTSGKTLPVVPSENKIELSVHGITSNSAMLKATVSNDDIYYMGAIERAKADNMSDQEIVNYMEAQGGSFFQFLLSKGNDCVSTGLTLKSATDYYAIAYGWDMALSTDVIKVPFSTLEDVDAPDVPQSIIIPETPFGEVSVSEITYDSYHMVIKPANETTEYIMIPAPQKSIASFKTDEDIVRAVLTSIDNMGNNVEMGGDIYDAWGDYVYPLPIDQVQRSGVSAGTDYSLVVFGIDRATLQPTTECIVREFSTPAGAPATAKAATAHGDFSPKTMKRSQHKSNTPAAEVNFTRPFSKTLFQE